MTTVKDAKVKLMEATGDLDYVAETLGISTADADALRTYKQYSFDGESPIIQALQSALADGLAKVSKMVAKADLPEKDILELAIASKVAELCNFESILVTAQNLACVDIKSIPRKVVEKVAVSKETVSVDGI